jgi:hypothetical protein
MVEIRVAVVDAATVRGLAQPMRGPMCPATPDRPAAA